MAATVRSILKVDAKVTVKNSLDLGSPEGILKILSEDTWEPGTGSSQVDRVFSDTRSAAAAVDTLDLAGVLTDAFGATLTFAKVTGIIIKNKETATGKKLTLGGNANPFLPIFGDATDKLIVGPGGVLVLTGPVDGYAVTAGTGDKLDIDPGANTVAYDIIILGRSA